LLLRILTNTTEYLINLVSAISEIASDRQQRSLYVGAVTNLKIKRTGAENHNFRAIQL
jgi:hypothetical protein